MMTPSEFDFACERPDGSVYANQYETCLKGTYINIPDRLLSHGIFRSLSDDQAKRMVKQTAKFFDKVDSEGYKGFARGVWEEAVTGHFDALLVANGRGKAYTPDEIVSISGKTLNKASKELIGNAPTKLDYGTKDLIEASVGMRPEIRARQIGWRDPITGDKVGFAVINSSNERVSKKNGVSDSDFSRWLWSASPKAAAYKEKLESQGIPWPRPKDRVPSKEEIDDLVKKNPGLWKAGLNDQNKEIKRDDAFAVYEINSKNPSAQALEARELKSRAVAEAWLSQNGISTMTGEPMPLPRGKRERGEAKSTVDHIEPISTWNHLPARERTLMADRAENYQIIEASLNTKKSDGGNEAVLSGNDSDRVYAKMATNWGNNGSRVTLSEKEYRSRFSSSLEYSNQEDMQKFASAYEQRRLAAQFNKPAGDVVPIARARRINVYDGFTPPDGTVAIKQNTPEPTAQKKKSDASVRAQNGGTRLTKNRLRQMSVEELKALAADRGLYRYQREKAAEALKERNISVPKTSIPNRGPKLQKTGPSKSPAEAAEKITTALKKQKGDRQLAGLKAQVSAWRAQGLTDGRIRSMLQGYRLAPGVINSLI